MKATNINSLAIILLGLAIVITNLNFVSQIKDLKESRTAMMSVIICQEFNEGDCLK